MKVIIAAIALIGAMSSLVGSANADVSISLRFGSSPSYRSYPERYRNYRHHNNNSRVIVREVYPATTIIREVYPAGTIVREVYPAGTIVREVYPAGTIVREVYPATVIYPSTPFERRYNSSQDDRYGDRYIVEKRSR